MPRIVRGGLIQVHCDVPGDQPPEKIKKYLIEKHLKLIQEAGQRKVQILCLQELLRSLFPGGAGS
jgi:beta-ureidopropionase